MKNIWFSGPLLCMFVFSCGNSDAPGKQEGSTDSEAAAGLSRDVDYDENPVVGDTCNGLPANQAVVACSDNKVLFCSSFYDYKWTETLDCSDTDSTCSASENGRSGVCK